jgi:NAD-dependent SIR2 family protein deacetylase
MNEDDRLQRAAEVIASAEALVIGAGAGMGVDSGLPDFRGTQGFWRAYPPFARLGLDFAAVANPVWFRKEPALGWGFYGHRLNLYRATVPHAGFQILQSWARPLRHGAFVYTSNVDGHFQRSGFDAARVLEVHGAIDWMQCMGPCGNDPFLAGEAGVAVDETTMRAADPLPACPVCGALARPNILMFNDWDWDASRAEAQQARFESWLEMVQSCRLAIVECGAGTEIPTVRRSCEALARLAAATLIRINPREPEVPAGHISLAVGALEGLRAIDQFLSRKS